MSAEIPVTVFTETLKKNGKEGEIKDIAADSQAYIVGAEVYVTADSTISPTEFVILFPFSSIHAYLFLFLASVPRTYNGGLCKRHGFHNSPGKSADLHVTLLIKEKRGDIVGLKFIYTVDGSVWDRLHVPKNARGYGFTKGNVLAVISEDDYKTTRGYSFSLSLSSGCAFR